jgi:basic amino acid/polyamine antiporter, APA family
MAASSADAKLVRAIGTRELTASIINVTIASSIFLMPATVAERLGPAAPLA